MKRIGRYKKGQKKETMVDGRYNQGRNNEKEVYYEEGRSKIKKIPKGCRQRQMA